MDNAVSDSNGGMIVEYAAGKGADIGKGFAKVDVGASRILSNTTSSFNGSVITIANDTTLSVLPAGYRLQVGGSNSNNAEGPFNSYTVVSSKVNAGNTEITIQESLTTENSTVGVNFSQPNLGSRSNDLGSSPVMFDPVNNGQPVGFLIRRKRSSSLGVADGAYQIWQQLNGGAFIKTFESIGFQSFNEADDNKFGEGYCLGAANSGFSAETTFYLRRHYIYYAKPDSINGQAVPD